MRTRYYSSLGFTLLEVLVSTALLAIVIVLLIGITGHTTQIWHHGEIHRNAAREIRAGLEILTEDLHSAVLTTNPSTLLISREKTGSRIFFAVSHPGEKRSIGNEGDLCATGYFIAEDPKQKGSSNLYRFHASGDVAAKAYEKNSLPELYASASPTNAGTTELLARHLVKLDVRRLDAPPSDQLLLITLSAPSNAKAAPSSQPLRDDQLLRYTTIVRLPPVREQPPTK